MRIRLLLTVGLLVMVGGIVVAQETLLNPQYTARASGVGEQDLPGRVNLAMWAFKNGMFAETVAECQKIRALSPGDLRAEYLARAANFYRGTDVGRFEAEEADGTADTRPPATGGQTTVINLTDEEVRELFAQYGGQGLNEYRTTVNSIIVRTCGTANCHGNVETAGRLYIKSGTDNKSVAENFKALDQFIDHRELARSRLLTIAVADKPEHPGGQILQPTAPAFRRLETWVKGLWTEGLWD